MSEEWIGYPAEDGKQYAVGKAKANDPKTFLDFFESNDLTKAKEKCISVAEKDGLQCILWDRKTGGIIYRHVPSEGAEDVKPKPVVPARKSRKRPTTGSSSS